MSPLRMLAIVLCGVSALALALCLFTSGNDGLLLPLALGSAAATNVTDRCAEKKSREGEYHE